MWLMNRNTGERFPVSEDDGRHLLEENPARWAEVDEDGALVDSVPEQTAPEPASTITRSRTAATSSSAVEVKPADDSA